MKNKYCLVGLLILIYCTKSNPVLCQIDQDSLLQAHSERWKVKANEGLFGMAKPRFGPFTTLEVTKNDIPVVKRKRKDSTSPQVEFSREGADLDISKFMTVEKLKFYRLLLAGAIDTEEAIFSISSVSREKKQAFLGNLLSKKDEGKDLLLSYKRDVSGTIKAKDSVSWMFFITNFSSGSRKTAESYFPSATISGAYLKNENDSFYLQPHSSFSADMILLNANGEHLAAIEFIKTPAYIWIRQDINASCQYAIATLFALVIAIKDL